MTHNVKKYLDANGDIDRTYNTIRDSIVRVASSNWRIKIPLKIWKTQVCPIEEMPDNYMKVGNHEVLYRLTKLINEQNKHIEEWVQYPKFEKGDNDMIVYEEAGQRASTRRNLTLPINPNSEDIGTNAYMYTHVKHKCFRRYRSVDAYLLI